MPIDERLRRGLAGLDAIESFPQPDLVDSVLRRGRRRRTVRRITAGIALLCAVAVCTVVVSNALDAVRVSRDVLPASPEELLKQLSGTYVVQVAPGKGSVSAYDLAGTWTVQLLATGALQMTPPPAFTRSWGAPTGASITVSGGTLRTNAFPSLCGGAVATYEWALRDGRLSLDAIRDNCPSRRALFTFGTWNREA